ncbi:MAG TPA: penicillin-binding transpeptidase domain-containing protein [Longimicrobiales bacterium]
MRVTARSHAWRRRALLAGLLLAGSMILGRGFQLQVLEGARWRARALGQHRQRVVLPAPRGTIYDRNGVPLAASREAYRVSIAPRELRDRAAVAARLREVLELTSAQAARAVDPRRVWSVLPGRYDEVARQRLAGEPGIYFEKVVERLYPHGELALELVGRVGADGRAQGGLELEFDSLLSGQPGEAVAKRDAWGRVIPGSLIPVVEPVPGHDVVLTIDYALQEIADDALRRAVEQTEAVGGDLVLADPETGEILAAATVRRRGPRNWLAVMEPYEPGSTIKPFVVAALLAEHRATLGDSIFAEHGRYEVGGRTITDEHGYGWLTLRDALRFSSNIAMAKAARRLEPADQYGYLRDFGFGTPTGVPYPSEASGLLRRPDRWSRYSQSSLAMGYEVSVTPLQMVLAYGALANGGVLMEPRLVREVRSRGGRVIERFDPRPVRRVVPEAVARQISDALVEVVEAGTGRAAGLGSFQVAGKTGTARQFRNGRYEAGSYTASFAGFFPAEDPQFSFLVRLDRPKGAYYGGLAAAPVMRATLAAALAARETALDRRAVAAAVVRAPVSVGRPSRLRRGRVGSPAAAVAPAVASLPPAGPFIFALDASPPQRFVAAAAPAPREVPDVVGLSLRDAARLLHAAGFRVVIDGSGAVAGTTPGGGALARPGAVVRIRGREARR